MQDFSKVLHEQADTLDTIEANVEQVQFFWRGVGREGIFLGGICSPLGY